MTDADLAGVRQLFVHAMTAEDRERCPGYGALCESLSESDVAIRLLSEVRTEQRTAMLILAALHYRALSGDVVLSRLFSRLTSDHPIPPNEFARGVRTRLENSPSLVADELHRTTQTNEVGRSAVLRAILTELRSRGLERVGLIDVGASAGLNLYLDRYPVSESAGGDPLTLVCQSLSGHPMNGPLPEIDSRVGIDLHPLSLSDPDSALWLRACLWPEDQERARRLDAIKQEVGDWEPVTVLAGRALERLDEAIARSTPDTPLILWHTWALAYFPESEQRSFATRMRELVTAGRITWVSIEWPRAVPGLQLPERTTDSPTRSNCQIVVAEAGDVPRHWGWCQHHGRWLSLSPAAGPNA